ncbi:protein kinase subdomain-containing protein PKL CAK Fmp29 [Mycena sanguinolenta]|nr:protein kinase subdomain-containing protein PKL CAK Fmp29 [Mycena sanguinolenta]
MSKVSQFLRCSHSLLPSFPFTYSNSITIRPQCRALSGIAHIQHDFFDYTSGRWIFNKSLRLAERRRVFNVDGRLAAASVGKSSNDILDFKKLAEGGFNRTFLITMHDNFQTKLVVASEVATMDLLRSSGLLIPGVYGYSASTDNEAETEYIFMEFVQGTCLRNLWFDLGEEDFISLLRQVVELESKMTAITFPAGGSLYYPRDLEKITGSPGLPLEDGRLCVGPETSHSLWCGRRAQLDVDQGPYQTAEAVLVSGAHNELAYLKKFDKYQVQPPSKHMDNLNRYLLLLPSLIPRDTALSDFRIRHPDIRPDDIIVDSNLHIVGLMDWQNILILPDKVHSQPSLPEDSDDLEANQEEFEVELRRRRLTLALKIDLIDAMEDWEALAGESTPCPIVFDPVDVRETRELQKIQTEPDEDLVAIQSMLLDGWVPVEYYEEIMAQSKKAKEAALVEAESEEERAVIEAHWPFDDMDEEEYMNGPSQRCLYLTS